MGNILENTVECTCEEFVAEIAGKRRKPYLDALKSTFKTIVLGKSTLVKEMSSFLRENEGRLERKRVQELMSGWLNAYDFAALLNPCLLARSAADVTDEATLAVDFSDNAADIALRTHSLLAGIRTLASKARIRFISGRPRTRGRLLPGQLTFDLRTADGSVYRL